MDAENSNTQAKTPAELAKEAMAKRMTGKGKGGGSKVNNTAIEAAKKEASKKKKTAAGRNNFVKGAKDGAFCPMTTATTQ